VTDILIACNFGKDKTAYIPTIAWGKQARKSGKYTIGTMVNIVGRIQSRKYVKVFNGLAEDRVAYELSINSIEKIETM
jgi:single-stranded DNA-binding protein